jgi:hypothetical protein
MKIGVRCWFCSVLFFIFVAGVAQAQSSTPARKTRNVGLVSRLENPSKTFCASEIR